LVRPNSGGIYYNELKLESISDILKSKAAFVPQDIFIIDDTLVRNITLEVDENCIDFEALNSALISSQLMDVVQSSPDGIYQKLGDKGVSLSGGQRQRVALARALYHDREILVMDEATSALDSETELEIVKEVERLKGEKTIILIAHKLSTLKKCDQIIKMQRGKIVQIGSFADVVSQEE